MDIGNLTLFEFWIGFLMPYLGGASLVLSIRLWWVEGIAPLQVAATVVSLGWAVVCVTILAEGVAS